MSISAFKILLCFVAGVVILLGTSSPTAARRRAPLHQPGGLPEIEIQVLLDRAGLSPGEIDGKAGKNAREARAAFRAARAHAPGTRSREALLKALGVGRVQPIVSYTITQEDAAGPFAETIPKDPAEQSQLPGLYYTSVLEELGEKFHSAPTLIKRLNPRASLSPGEHIRVPNVLLDEDAPDAAQHPGGDQDNKREPQTRQNGHPALDKAGLNKAGMKVVVSKSGSNLKVYDREGKLILYAPVTSGSEHDPLPLGNWAVTSVVRNPTFNYNPDLFWDADAANAKVKIAPGPNNPVGVVWIGINVPHYGIHGTPEPGRIGHAASHGCVRMTNWDATRLADLVTKGTPVVFAE